MVGSPIAPCVDTELESGPEAVDEISTAEVELLGTPKVVVTTTIEGLFGMSELWEQPETHPFPQCAGVSPLLKSYISDDTGRSK